MHACVGAWVRACVRVFVVQQAIEQMRAWLSERGGEVQWDTFAAAAVDGVFERFLKREGALISNRSARQCTLPCGLLAGAVVVSGLVLLLNYH